MKKSNIMPLSERLEKIGSDQPKNFPFYTLFLEDYFRGLCAVTFMPYFASCYDSNFLRYDPDAIILLPEMVEQVINFLPDKRGELLYYLLIEPFVYIKLQKGS